MAKIPAVSKTSADSIDAPTAVPIADKKPVTSTMLTNSLLNKLGFVAEVPQGKMQPKDRLSMMRLVFVENATRHIDALNGKEVIGRNKKPFNPTWYKQAADGTFNVTLKNGHIVFRIDNKDLASARLVINAANKAAVINVLDLAARGCEAGDLDDLLLATVGAGYGAKKKAKEAVVEVVKEVAPEVAATEVAVPEVALT